MYVCVCVLNHVRLFVTPQTVAHQGPPSMGFSRQEYWSGVPLPSPIGRLVPSNHGLLQAPLQRVVLSSP